MEDKSEERWSKRVQGGDLAADSRLAHAQRFTRVSEAAGLGGGMEDA